MPQTLITKGSWFYRLLPFMQWLPRVRRSDLRADGAAGLIGAIVMLPQGVAFATIAGMPPEYGLYAGMVPAIIAALFGSSRHLVSGPTTAASIVLFSALSVHATPGTAEYVTLALTLTFMVGVIELLLGLARMGALVNFISHSVVVGFTAGAAILIAAKQLKHFFGVEIPLGGHLHDILIAFFNQRDDINPYVTIVSVVTLGTGIVVKRSFPKLPHLIIAMLCGSVIAWLIDFFVGSDVARIPEVGALPASLPPLSAPELSLDNIRALSFTALAVTMFALTEAVSIGRSMAAHGGYRIDGNQEFIGQGLSNIAGAFFSGYVATGSFNRSGINFQAGARTPLAAVIAGCLLIVIVLLIAPMAAHLPKAAMAGLLFIVAWGLIDFAEIRHILVSSRQETAVLATTFFSALFLELEFAIFAGVLLSLVLYLQKASKPRIVRRVPDPNQSDRAFVTDTSLPECPQLRIARVDGPIFFGSANHVQGTLDLFRAANPEQKHLAIAAEGINFVDLQGGDLLREEARRRNEQGGGLYLINVKDGLREDLRRSGCLEEMGSSNVFRSKKAAIRGIFGRLDKSLCSNCDKRIFNECKTIDDT